MSTDYAVQRSISDIQSKIASLDYGLTAARRPRARPGQQMIQRAAAKVALACGDTELASVMETKAATSPAMSTVATWATELTQTGLPGFVLSLERQSALATILAKSPQVGTLANGAVRVPVAALAPAVAEGSAIPVLKGSFSPLTLSAFKLAAICHFSHELAELSMIENAVRVLLSQLRLAWIASRSRTRRSAACSTV
jgi:hypothetical protein